MYGSTQNPPELYEEYVSLNQFNDMEIEEKRDNSTLCNTAGCVLLFASCYGVAFYVLFYYF